MSLIASDRGRSFTPVPPGNHIARLYQVVDLGTQFTTGKFGDKSAHTIRLGFELFGEDADGKPLIIPVNGKPMPLTITRKYTASLHKKATLRRDLVAWRGRDFDDNESIGFDITSMVDQFCLLNVTHTLSNGQTYSNIAGLSPLPAALRRHCPAPVHPRQIFDLSAPDMAVFVALSDTLRNQIITAPEAAGLEIVNRDTGEITRPAARTVAQPAAPAAPVSGLPGLLPAEFVARLDAWRGVITSGKKTPEQVVAMVQSRHALTPDQIASILTAGDAA